MGHVIEWLDENYTPPPSPVGIDVDDLIKKLANDYAETFHENILNVRAYNNYNDLYKAFKAGYASSQNSIIECTDEIAIVKRIYDAFANWYHDDGSYDTFLRSSALEVIKEYAIITQKELKYIDVRGIANDIISTINESFDKEESYSVVKDKVIEILKAGYSASLPQSSTDEEKDLWIGMIKWIRENYEPEFGDGRHWEDILDEAETPISDKELYNLYKQSKK